MSIIKNQRTCRIKASKQFFLLFRLREEKEDDSFCEKEDDSVQRMQQLECGFVKHQHCSWDKVECISPGLEAAVENLESHFCSEAVNDELIAGSCLISANYFKQIVCCFNI